MRVLGFASGRGFREEQVYLAVVNAYCMGNPRGPLRNDSVASAIPCPGKERIIRDYLARYISGAPDPVLPDFPWRWSVECAGEGEHGEGETAALYADTPVEGGTYLVFHEATASVLTGESTETGLLFAACRTVPDGISAPLPDTAMPLRVHYTGKNRLTLMDAKGCVLTAREGLERTEMTEMTQAEGAGEWILERVHGGWRIRSAFLRRGEKSPWALQVSAGSLQTRPMERNGLFIFNFYAPR